MAARKQQLGGKKRLKKPRTKTTAERLDELERKVDARAAQRKTSVEQVHTEVERLGAPHSQRLYRYRPLSGSDDLRRLYQIIRDHKIWYSAPADFNDPFDCRFCVSMEGCPPEDYSPGTPEWAKQFAEEWLRDEAVANHAILTLSELRDDILMWAHYASSHSGVCLELTVPKRL
jgi:hypothetical protein